MQASIIRQPDDVTSHNFRRTVQQRVAAVLALSQPVCLPLIGAAAASPGMAVKQTESVLNKSCPISQNDTTVYN